MDMDATSFLSLGSKSDCSVGGKVCGGIFKLIELAFFEISTGAVGAAD